MEKLRIIIGGFLGKMPAGGVTRGYIQYPHFFCRQNLYLPVKGLFAFTNLNEAINVLQSVVSHLSKYSITARDIAAEYFDSKKSLNHLLERIA
jgi:hypothetical protein